MNLSKYNKEIKDIITLTSAPYRGIIIDVVEYPDYLALRVYRDNIESFSENQKVSIAEYLYKLRDTINNTGTICYLEGVEYGPN